MATLQIYGVPPSPFTRAARLACHEKGVDYELVSTPPGGTAPKNPLGKIPMMNHGDFTLFESQAIVRYVDHTFDGPPLWPKEAHAAALCDQWLSVVCDSMVHRFLAGEQVTAADLFLVPIFFYFPAIPELKALGEASPNCGRWVREMGARPSVQATDPQFRGLNR